MHHVSAALLTAFLLSTAPASAQGNTVRQGVLTCRVSASVGLLVGSRQRLRCQFRSESGRTQNYIGTIGRLFEGDIRGLLAAIRETLDEMGVKILAH